MSVNSTAAKGGEAELGEQKPPPPSQPQEVGTVESKAAAHSDAAAPSDAAPSGAVAGPYLEDPAKKVRKPYTITKSRESWTEQEHDRFLEALHLFDRDWKKIEAFIGSKTVIQIRSHAQKYFLKVQKNGTSEHVPPPRPKRKASHPYPQKASKNVTQSTVPVQTSSSLVEPAYSAKTESLFVLRSSAKGATAVPWNQNSVPPLKTSPMIRGPLMANNFCSSSTESLSPNWQTHKALKQDNRVPLFRVMPDFAQVYSFIGSVFDPDATDHLQKLKEMNPIDVETVLLLMRNLSMNLTSSEFEDHRQLLASYQCDSEKEKSCTTVDVLKTEDAVNAPSMVKIE